MVFFLELLKQVPFSRFISLRRFKPKKDGISPNTCILNIVSMVTDSALEVAPFRSTNIDNGLVSIAKFIDSSMFGNTGYPLLVFKSVPSVSDGHLTLLSCLELPRA